MTPHPVLDADAVATALRGASLDQLGRELARRAVAFCDSARLAKDLAFATDNPVSVAANLEAARQSAVWCGRLASAVLALLGSGDDETVNNSFALAGTAREYVSRVEARLQWVVEREGKRAHA
jgi:hypothetical protein